MGDIDWGADETQERRRVDGALAEGSFEVNWSSCGCMLVLGCAALVALGYVAVRSDYIPGNGLAVLYGAFLLAFAVPAGIGALGWWLLMGHPSGERRRAVAVAVALVLGAGLVIDWAPWDALKTYYVADTAGVVASTRYDPTGVERVVLENGRTIEVWVDQGDGQRAEASWHVSLRGHEQRTGVGVGELLLAGDKPFPWFTTAGGYCPGRNDGHVMRDTTGFIRADTVELDSGLRLPKASDYRGGTGRPFGGWPCLNAQGQVVSVMDYY